MSTEAANWAKIEGEWDTAPGRASFRKPVGEPPFGLAVSSLRVRNGFVESRITIQELMPDGQTAAGICLGYNAHSAAYVVAQIGGFGAAYSVARYAPGSGWYAVDRSGTSSNVEKDRPYNMRVDLTGQRLHLSVDGIRVLDTLLDSPLAGDQAGVAAWSRAPVEFENYRGKGEQLGAFIAMQFGEPFDTFYKEVIKPQAERVGFAPLRIDELSRPGVILEDIKTSIENSDVVIVEITAANENVFYEVGYAHALGKPTILLAERGRKLPFDLSGYRVIFYDNTIGGKPVVEKELARHLSSLKGGNGSARTVVNSG